MLRRLVALTSLALTILGAPRVGAARPFDMELFLHLVGSLALPVGGYRYVDTPDLLAIRISVFNHSDTPVRLPVELDSLIRVEIVSTGVGETPVRLVSRSVSWKRRAENVPEWSPLSEDEGVEVLFTFHPVNGLLAAGSYLLRVDMSALGARLEATDGSRWPGTWPGPFEKPLSVAKSTSRQEWIHGRALLASAHASQPSKDRARAIFLELSRVAPESPVGPLGLGRLDLEHGNYRDAAIWLQRVMDLGTSPESHTWRSLALAYVGSGQDARAREILRRSLSESDTESELLRIKHALARRSR